MHVTSQVERGLPVRLGCLYLT